MSRHLDTSTETPMAQIMIQCGRSIRSSWTKSVRSSVGRTVMEKAFWESSIGARLVKSSELGCVSVNPEQGLFLSVTVDDIKLAGKKQNLDPRWEILSKEVDLGEPTSFLDHLYLGCSQRQCETSQNIVDNCRSWISACQKVYGTLFWISEQNNATVVESLHSLPSIQRWRILLIWRIARCMLSNCPDMSVFGTHW